MSDIEPTKPQQDRLGKFKPASNAFEFREYPFYWVMRLGSRYTQAMEIQLKKIDMNITTWRISLILRENGTLSMTKVAEHAVGRLPTITKSVYRMQEQGWVDVKTNEQDGRVTMVSITKKGLATVNKVIASTERLIDRAFDEFSEKEIEELNQLLQKVFNNLSDD